MSRKATMGYVGAKRRAYSKLKSKKAKSAAIDDFCQVTGAERKYAIRLLTGNRKYRDHAGRGKTYTPGAEALFLRLWRASGRMTPRYLVTVADRQMAALRELEHVDEAAAAQVLRMSASTMERILRKHPREAPRRRNRRSGANALASSVPCVPGEALPPAAPGDTQVDTVALCGGDMSGNFFWILTLTDRLTQWTELRCVWNRGAAATKEGLADAEAAFPFPLTAMHSDSGLEFLNAHVLGYARDRPRPLAFTRSRPGNKNDNARVEQKNASVVREYFGYERIDRLELKKDMDVLCAKISLYNNLFRPCKRLISKTKRPDSHGFSKRYDKPATPLDRVIASGYADPAVIRRLTALREKTNPIRLLEDIRRRYALILRKQNKLAKREAQGMTTPGSAPFTPLTSPSSLDPLGVQYLTDRHRLKKTYGVFSI
ncbi:MAG: hypothetical protein ACOX7Q_03225 [Kiritimatiellia bacterium]